VATLLRIVSVALFSAAAAASSAAQQVPGMQRLGDGIYVYTESDGGEDPATVSSLVVITEEGVVVGDGLGRVGDLAESARMAERLIAEIRALTDQPIVYLVNCSWHPDHTNGNHVFREAGARILSHRSARDGLLAYYSTQPDITQAAPDVVFDEELTVFLGGREIRLLFLGRAHTDGDVVVFLPRERIAFLSEIHFHDQFPGLRSGFPSDWIETLDRVLALDADVFVPGHGLVVPEGTSRASVEGMRADLVAMREEVRGYFEQGLDRDQILARAPLARWAGLINAYRNLPIAVDRILAELRGDLPPAR
jgi:glyoxylase-like metal-dependent hydrolase (beta-lactamase superfamily II)